MTSGNIPSLTAALLIATAPAAWSATGPDPSDLLKRLAQPAPATTPFTEVRFSQLLDQPLIVSGTLEYSGQDTLVRTVTSPLHERTEIRGETVIIDRGRAHREVSLSQVPELRSLIAGFTGLLSGDAAKLTQSFQLSSSGDEAHWTLQLKPIDPRVARRVRTIDVTGAHDKPICIITSEANNNATLMVLQGPESVKFRTPLARETVERYCAGGKL